MLNRIGIYNFIKMLLDIQILKICAPVLSL